MRRPALALFLLAGFAPPGAFFAVSVPDPCRLLAPADVARIAGGRVVETRSASRVAGDLAISDCFFRSEPFESSVSLELTREAPGAARRLKAHWEAVFHGERGEEAERSDEARKEAPPREVEGVGDEAFWLGNPVSGALYVLRKDRYLRISVGGAEPEPVKIRKAVDLARKALART